MIAELSSGVDAFRGIGTKLTLTCDFPRTIGSPMRTKVEYIIDTPAKHARSSSRLRFEPVTTRVARSIFRKAIRDIIKESLDRSDQAAVASGQIEAQADRLAEPDEGLTYDPAWWALAYKQDDQLIGIAQPVIFAGCERNGLQEGTIHYIGVLPLYRGQGYINDLVRFTTWRLAEIGLWRIYTDTDELNMPMRRAFLRAGYREAHTCIIKESLRVP